MGHKHFAFLQILNSGESSGHAANETADLHDYLIMRKSSYKPLYSFKNHPYDDNDQNHFHPQRNNCTLPGLLQLFPNITSHKVDLDEHRDTNENEVTKHVKSSL